MKPLDPQAARLRADSLVVLDARDEEAFTAGHLAGSGNIPGPDLVARRAELPPREAAILVVAADAPRACEAAATLETLGYAGVSYLDAPLSALPGGLADRGRAARLWRPAPFLEEVLPLLRQRQAEARQGAAPPGGADEAGGAPPGAGRALDLACGSGRDSVFLALRGFDVEAWDHDPEALQRTRDLARRHGVSVHTALRDLERPGLPLPVGRFDLVICFRFLHRPLFHWIEQALAPGGWLVYETYRAGQERYGKPKRAHFLLQPGELAHAFPGLVTLRCEERQPAGGPVTARLLARKQEGG